MVAFDRSRMEGHIARQDDGYARRDAEAIRNSTMTQPSRIHKELYLFALLREELSGGAPISRLLEVGCGIGMLTGALRSLADKVVAFDLSPAGVAAARERLTGWPGIALCVADGTDPRGSTDISAGEYDMILIREFHPFTRDLYASRAEADRVHGAVMAAYAGLLAPGGLLVLSHAEVHAQTIRPERAVLPADCSWAIARVDPRLLSVFLFLTRNRLNAALHLTRLVQKLAWRLTGRSVLYVLRRKAS